MSKAIAKYLKVVRRKKSLSAEGTRGGEHERGDYSCSHKGGLGDLPKENFGILALLCAFLMGVLSHWDQISAVLVWK